MRAIDTLIIHCSATKADWMYNASPQTKANEIRKWHLKRGFSDIGYHYLIDRDGTLIHGRDLDDDGDVEEHIGAHAKGYNKTSIGICLLGGYGSNENDDPSQHYTEAQLDALWALIQSCRTRYAIKRIMGHNEVAAKACPGFRVGKFLKHRATLHAQSRGDRTSPTQSKTLRASAAKLAAEAAAAITAITALDGTAQIIVLGGAIILGGLTLYIMRERLKAWAKGWQ